MSTFDQCFHIVVGYEGGYTKDDRDPGNWTGGRCGIGTCKGTMFGISAAAYPALDIPAIQLDDAKLIYRRDYYDRMDLDLLPPRLALIVFDSAVNSGVGTAVRWLQTCVGTTADGVLGPGTQLAVRAALAKDGLDELCACYLALRLTTLARLAIWPTYGSGWARRVCRLAFQSCGMGVT